MFLPFAFQAGGPGKSCPAIALPHGQCLSRRSREHFLLPRSVHLPGCILATGKELAQVLSCPHPPGGKKFCTGKGGHPSPCRGPQLEVGMARGSHQPTLQPPAMGKPWGGLDVSRGQVGAREHVYSGWASPPSCCGCALGVPAPGTPQWGLAAGTARCTSEGGSRELRLAEQPQQAMPACRGQALGAGEHEGGQSPSRQPRRELGTAGMWHLAPSPRRL